MNFIGLEVHPESEGL